MITYTEEKTMISKLNLQEVDPQTFYRSVFPEGSLERAGKMQTGKYNAMVSAHWSDEKHRDILCVNDDLSLLSSLRTKHATMNCVSYVGSVPHVDYARDLYAFFIKLKLTDSYTPSHRFWDELKNYLEWGQLVQKRPQKTESGKYIWGYTEGETMDFIRPAYLVIDGNTLYLCFIMKRPVPLFANYKKRLQVIYNDISKKINEGLHLSIPRPESILTPRTVIGKSSLAGSGGPCRAFRISDMELPFITLDELNMCVAKNKQLHIKYPEDYQWNCNTKMYDWFLQLVRKNADNSNLKPSVFLTIAAYAVKSGITDYDLFTKTLNTMGETLGHRFTASEICLNIHEARYMYLNHAYGLRRRSIDYLREESGIDIPKNQRNGKKQADHCRALNNAKRKRSQVLQWMKAHPEAKKIDCARALGIAPSTVTKWTKRADKKSRPTSRSNKCPECGALVKHYDREPWFNVRLGIHRQRVDSFCSNPFCKHSRIPLRKTYRDLPGECLWTEGEKWNIALESNHDKSYLRKPQYDEDGIEVKTERPVVKKSTILGMGKKPEEERNPNELPF